MLKFLRRYQAWILAIGGSLLMIAFLLPQAIQRLGNRVVVNDVFQLTIDGKATTIDSREWQAASSELAILEAMFNSRDIGPLLSFPAHDSDNPDSPGLRGADHWIMLKREAELAGLIGGPGDGDQQLIAQATAVANEQRVDGDEVYKRLSDMLLLEASRSNLSLDDGKRAYATLAGIGRLIDKYAAAPPASDNRVRHIVDQFEDKVNLALVYVDAVDHIADLPEPDESLLLEQFEKYRELEAGADEQGFGYRLNDRAKVEYLTIRFQSVLDQVDASGLEARKWFQRNASDVRPNPDGTTPSFDEVADDAIEAYRRAKAEEMVTEISRFIKGELLKDIQSLPHDDGYRVLPDDWSTKQVSFEALRDQIQQQFGVAVEYHADTQKWHTMSDLGQLEGVGGGMRVAGANNMSFSQLVQAHRELGKSTVPGLQAGLADSTLLRRNEINRGRVGPTSFRGDAYLYRVIAVDPARAPTSLDEVREAVVKDVKRQQAYEKLTADIDAWWRRGLDEGLEELAESLDDRIVRGSVSRYGSMNSKPGDYQPNTMSYLTSRTLVTAVFDRVNAFEPLTRIADLPMEQRLLTTPIPERLGVAVVRLESHFPTTRQRWLSILDTGMRISGRSPIPATQVLMNRDFADPEMAPFSFEAMKQRFEYVDMRPESERESDEPDGMAAPEGSG